MELLQIIIFSIKIFALVATLIVISSYLIYKLKDRKRKKPYTKVPTQTFSVKPSKAEKQFSPGQYENIQMINEPVENEQIIYTPIESQQMINVPFESQQYDNLQHENDQYQNIQNKNMQYENQPMLVYQKHQPRLFGQRFKILNEDNNSMAPRKSIIERLQPVTAAPQNFNALRQSQVFNMYDYYSSSNFEPMHKIKLY